jgi:uncharacterized protein YbbK (DUF523 family)
MILVSACLLGYPCRYDGLTTPCPELMEQIRGKAVMAVCPEQLGGLPTPRPAADISMADSLAPDGLAVIDGRAQVIDRNGSDRTEAFIKGARCVLTLAEQVKANAVYLKNRSPSCAVHPFVDKKGKNRGTGVTAAMLKQAGFRIIEVTAASSSTENRKK